MGLFRRRSAPDSLPALEPDDEAPGWDCIDAAWAAVHPGQKPRHMATIGGRAFGAPLDGISAYVDVHGWHYVTYGLSELFTKESGDPERSGWGYELTLRTPRSDEPATWAFDTLAGLAKITWAESTVHDPGDRIDLGCPIDGVTSALTAYAVVLDPDVPPTSSPFGRVAFHRLVGITADELADAKSSTTAAVIARLATADEHLVTDPDRD